jgi:hypothetical protein
MKSKLYVLIAILLLIPACSTTTVEPGIPTLLISGSHSAYANSQPMVRLDNTNSSFSTTWQLMNANQIPQPDVPKLDFNRTRVVTFFLGQRPNGGYGFYYIQNATLEAQTLTVFVAIKEPKPETPIIPTISSAFSSLSYETTSFTRVRVMNFSSGAVMAESSP